MLADIYLGKIKSWSDPAIKALNPDLALPDLAISVLHRQDGSGSTYRLHGVPVGQSARSGRPNYGADTLIAWPLGTGAEGTQDLIRAVQATKGAIAYAEYGQAQRAGLPFARSRTSPAISSSRTKKACKPPPRPSPGRTRPISSPR